MSHRLRLGVWCVLGVFITLGPMFFADILVRWAAVSFGSERMQDRAKHILDHAELILVDASTALTKLASDRKITCTKDGMSRISEVVFTHASLKEVGVYDANNRLLCTNLGLALRKMHHTNRVEATNGAVGLAMMPTRVAGLKSLGVHIERKTGGGGLVAIVEKPNIAFQDIHDDKTLAGFTRLSLTNGEPVVQIGTPVTDEQLAADFVQVRQTSSRFPIAVMVATPTLALLASFEKVQALAKIGGGVMGVIMLALGGAAARRRLSGQNEIGDALLADEFIAFYQPIVDAQTGRVSGCEVLVRWRKANGTMVSPDLFVPLAESTGQIIDITKRIMRQVAHDMAPICAVQPEFYVSVNLVAEHFSNNEIVSDIRQTFAKGAMTPANLVVEITERRPLLDMNRAKMVIETLQRLGVRVALDDAGTGHGGLAYIQSLGMDIIKIDRMFVEAIGTDAPSAPIVDALIDLGKQLKMTIIAEGVETENQFSYLRARGARFYQGYLFSPPMPIGAFVKFFGAFSPISEQAPAPSLPAVALGT